MLTTGAEARGIAGLVIDGGVRDVDALEAHGFPVSQHGDRAPGRDARCCRAKSTGHSVVGDADVNPGDWVVADADGVVVVPGDALDAVVAAGRARAAKEAQYFEQLRSGSTTVDLLSLDPSPIDGA